MPWQHCVPSKRAHANTTTPATPRPCEEKGWHLARQAGPPVPQAIGKRCASQGGATGTPEAKGAPAQELEKDCRRELQRALWPRTPQTMEQPCRQGEGPGPRIPRQWGWAAQYKTGSLLGRAKATEQTSV